MPSELFSDENPATLLLTALRQDHLEPRLTEALPWVLLHGGFAIALTYGLPRPTADIDVCEVVPHEVKAELFARAGEGSPLHKKYRVYRQMVMVPLDLELLRRRYRREVRPYLTGPPERGDLTLNLWCEAIQDERASPR